MKIPPVYSLNHEIIDLITKIEANKIFLESQDTPFKLKENLQRSAILKSSLFSARIEGNPLTLQDINVTSEKEKKREVFNILKAINFIQQHIKFATHINKTFFLKLHQIVMSNLGLQSGSFRKETGAIFNQTGVAVYVSPPANLVEPLINQLLLFINKQEDKFPLLTAFISHLVFEKIHPFIDGNGRVGRLLIFSILKAKGWNYPVFIPLEEYLDDHKDEYYYYMDKGYQETENYLIFMLEAFLRQSEKVKIEINRSQKESEPILPLRQTEIYRIIRDHHHVSFDRIKRRFLKVPARTIRYDLKKLQEKKLIIKVGITKGVIYSIKV